jgi:hypothetical protein
MKNNRTFINVVLMVMAILFAGTVFAGTSADTTEQTKGQHETIEGVLSIKEGHGDFLVRQSDGKAQRFSVRGDSAEITRNGKPARYNELKGSDNIKVKYDPANRKVIEIHASGS